jgi:hypothetical protein
MRKLLAISAITVALAVGADARTPGDDWAGVYKRRFENGLVDGTKYQSEDVLEIVPVDSDHFYLRMALAFPNGHSCSFHGIANPEGGRLVYRGPYDSVRKGACELTVSREKDEEGRDAVVLADRGEIPLCRLQTCGARGGYTGVSWPISSRRTIRYMDIVKRSWQYADALKEAGLPPPAN